MIKSSRCIACKHLHSTTDPMRTCNAFAQGIPDRIWFGDHNHDYPYPDDNGVRFEPANAQVAARERQLREEYGPRVVIAPEAAHLNPGLPVYDADAACVQRLEDLRRLGSAAYLKKMLGGDKPKRNTKKDS